MFISESVSDNLFLFFSFLFSFLFFKKKLIHYLLYIFITFFLYHFNKELYIHKKEKDREIEKDRKKKGRKWEQRQVETIQRLG